MAKNSLQVNQLMADSLPNQSVLEFTSESSYQWLFSAEIVIFIRTEKVDISDKKTYPLAGLMTTRTNKFHSNIFHENESAESMRSRF